MAYKCISEFTRSSVSRCISELTQSRPPSASLSSLDLGLLVHHLVHSVSASTYIYKLARSLPPSASLGSLDLSLQVHLHTRSGLHVHLQTRSIPASKYIFKEHHQVYGDTAVVQVDRVTGSVYSADPGVDRDHLISISSYHTMKIHTRYFPTFGLTRFVRDLVDPCNCIDP